jgi:hypothetical protein
MPNAVARDRRRPGARANISSPGLSPSTPLCLICFSDVGSMFEFYVDSSIKLDEVREPIEHTKYQGTGTFD